MKTEHASGGLMDITAPAAVVSGQFLLVGTILGVITVAAASGARVAMMVEGIHVAPKATGEAWTEGAKLYWDNTNFKFTTTSSGNTFRGCAADAAASGDTSGNVRLNPVSI
jgi:predicted RecA/RadA family phage recombinase